MQPFLVLFSGLPHQLLTELFEVRNLFLYLALNNHMANGVLLEVDLASYHASAQPELSTRGYYCSKGSDSIFFLCTYCRRS